MTGQPGKITEHGDWPLVRAVVWLFWLGGLVIGVLIGLMLGWVWFE